MNIYLFSQVIVMTKFENIAQMDRCLEIFKYCISILHTHPIIVSLPLAVNGSPFEFQKPNLAKNIMKLDQAYLQFTKCNFSTLRH